MSAQVRDIGKLFIRKDVQDILLKVTGFDMNKIFKSRFNRGYEKPSMQFLTDKQLQRHREQSIKKGYRYLKMPPFMKARESCSTIISKDDKLNMYNTSGARYVFTDISLEVPDRKRTIVVREQDGTLRNADWHERDKILQKYYPMEGRLQTKPKIFDPIQLEVILKEKRYQLILEKACVQFEPDDAEFIRVTYRTYEFINENCDFDTLKSTRFFGPMSYYLTWYKKLDNLLAYFLDSNSLDDCSSIIRLFNILHKESTSDQDDLKHDHENDDDRIQLIKKFIQENLKSSAKAELAILNFIERNKEKEQNKASN